MIQLNPILFLFWLMSVSFMDWKEKTCVVDSTTTGGNEMTEALLRWIDSVSEVQAP